ncbi:MAG TPA: sterol desaturase family protein [Polyangiales bacterium]|nr:sterol desaturase family protein [Polyangiales bacterium]
MYMHSNIGVQSGRLQYVVNGPEMHRLHHARGLPYPGVNFATKLAIWDWMFGTSYLPERQSCEYGLDGEVEFPAQFLQQQWFAFRPQPKVSADEPRADVYMPAADGGE